jgi:aspartate aminotransferase-like enzyme
MSDPAAKPKQQCFVVSQIGAEGSDERQRADWVLNQLVRDVAELLGFEVVRSDEIEKSGNIASQIINAIKTADLVVADLTLTCFAIWQSAMAAVHPAFSSWIKIS